MTCIHGVQTKQINLSEILIRHCLGQIFTVEALLLVLDHTPGEIWNVILPLKNIQWYNVFYLTNSCLSSSCLFCFLVRVGEVLPRSLASPSMMRVVRRRPRPPYSW